MSVNIKTKGASKGASFFEQDKVLQNNEKVVLWQDGNGAQTKTEAIQPCLGTTW